MNSKQALREQLARDIEGVYVKVYPPQEPDMFDDPAPWQRAQHSHKAYHAHTGLEPRLRKPNLGDLFTPPEPHPFGEPTAFMKQGHST